MKKPLGILLAALPVAALLLAGCEGKKRVSGSLDRTGTQFQEDLRANAIDNLNRIEEFDLSDLGEQVGRIYATLGQTGQLPDSVQNDPLLGGWPEPESLRQVVNRLNQWAQSQTPPADWKPDPLVDSLPAVMTDFPLMRGLGGMEFSHYDGLTLQEAVWLRDISQWAAGKQADGIQKAKNLFDWIARNIQIVPDAEEQLLSDGPDRLPLLPCEVLLLGRGTVWERAWVFTLLCRQQKLDAAVLALPVAGGLRLWCVAVLVEKGPGQRNLYLFDPALGVPIPGPRGLRLNSSGQLDIEPATLKQVLDHPELMSRLDPDPQSKPYWARRADLKRLVVLVEASPVYLSKRARMIESCLAGQQSVVLSTDATAQAQRMKATANAADYKPWPLPYQTLTRRWRATGPEMRLHLAQLLPFVLHSNTALYKGRIMMLKGKLTGPGEAIEQLQAARPSNNELQSVSIPVVLRERVQFGKVNASYWLGLIAYQQGHAADDRHTTGHDAAARFYDSALDYFRKRTLEAMPGADARLEQSLRQSYGIIAAAAHYSLGRTYEALGKRDQAVTEYEAVPPSSAYYPGNLLRARWLREMAPAAPAKAGGN